MKLDEQYELKGGFPSSFKGLRMLLSTLRGPNGCPWDKQQTSESLVPLMLEECYELFEAIEKGDLLNTMEEIGDVIFHLAFQMHIGAELNQFSDSEIFKYTIDKYVRRHPHVFGEVKFKSLEELKRNWERIKDSERNDPQKSTLDAVPKKLLTLKYADSLQTKAAQSGFDWENIIDVKNKITEELNEIEKASTTPDIQEEIGDLLFSIVNYSRHLGVDADQALRKANHKFKRRFMSMEEICQENNVLFKDLSGIDKDLLWDEVKKMEKNP